MKIELVPVIEIGYHNQNIKSPDESPYWENVKVWDKYNDDCYKKAGFKDKLIAYLPGSSFYRLKDISENNLIKLTKDHTEEMRSGKYARAQASAFFGGYVLHIDGQDKYFPQCCSDLSVIQYWEDLLTEDKPFFYQGHPEPSVSCTNDKIVFDFTVGEFEEYFVPPPPVARVEFKRTELKEAIERVRTELKIFANRIIKININEELKINDIEKLLIWGDDV